jgi:hypothetical protein
MVIHAVNAVVVRLARGLPGEDVNLMAAPLQGSPQFGDMGADAADGDGMKRFPRKQSDSHLSSSLDSGRVAVVASLDWSNVADGPEATLSPGRPPFARAKAEQASKPSYHIPDGLEEGRLPAFKVSWKARRLTKPAYARRWAFGAAPARLGVGGRPGLIRSSYVPLWGKAWRGIFCAVSMPVSSRHTLRDVSHLF